MTGRALPPFPKGVGVCELVPVDIAVTPNFPYLAVALEMVDSDGDGVRVLLDLPASLDLALRVSVAVARLRRLTP